MSKRSKNLKQIVDPTAPYTLDELVKKKRCEVEHLYFARYFFLTRQNARFIINWHHQLIADVVDDIIKGKVENALINVPPGGTKTELVVINLIARGLALNPYARFLHLSSSSELALLNSQTSRDIVTSDEFQRFWPMDIADDSKAKSRWNVMVNGKKAGGVYATSMNGQVTGFRAGHMAPGWNGAIIIDDPIKPEDALSEPKQKAINRRFINTVKSRRANPKTPIVVIMQRVGPKDPSQFILDGNLDGEWAHVVIPAMLTKEYIDTLSPKYRKLIDNAITDEIGRCSYWAYKEPIQALLNMEKGNATDEDGNRISRHVYAAQYNQNPVAMGGNLIKGVWFNRYTVLPHLKYRMMFADTAQKTAEHNDFSVVQCWGMGVDGKIYLLDQIRGKWEAPELEKRVKAFWLKHNSKDIDTVFMGKLRKIIVEDKASGTGLIQSLKLFPHNLPIFGVERNKDKYTRVLDAEPYMEVGSVCIPENADFTSDFVKECEAFMPDDSHEHDDQVDCLVDACINMLTNSKGINVWNKLGEKT